jgi:hypothetical protein
LNTLPDIVYYYEWHSDKVLKFDIKNQLYYVKSKGGPTQALIQVPYTAKTVERAYMHGDKITEEEFNNF